MLDNDEQIKQYRERLDVKRREVGKRPKVSFATNGLLTEFNNLNLNVATIDDCLKAATWLIGVNRDVDAAAEILELDHDESCSGGYTLQTWLDDLKQRVTLLKWEADKKKLNKMDKQLAELLSVAAKTAAVVDEIASELGIK